MKNFLFCEKGLFLPALVLSASIHGLLFSANGWIASVPYASVIRAPSSLEITVIDHPVVSVMEKEIVSEEIMDREAVDEVVFGQQAREPDPGKDIPVSKASRESRGALSRAEPVAHLNPAPPYPRIARQRGWEGTVRLEVLVATDGVPGRVGIRESSGHGVLDRAALETVEKWKFSPARSGPVRFPSRITIPIRFTLTKE